MSTDVEISPRPIRIDGEGVDRDAAAGSGAPPVTARAARRAFRRIHVGTWSPALVAFVIVGGAWQLIAVHNPQVLPTVPTIFRRLVDRPGFFAENAATTLREVAVGLGASAVVTFALAVVMCHFRVIERAMMPLAVVVSVTPIVSLAPGLVVAFGFGALPRYLVTGIIVFFPLLVNSLAGLRAVDPGALDLMKSMHASRWEILLRLRLPSSVPSLLIAARLCLPLSLVGAVVAEIAAPGNGSGLGSTIEIAANIPDLATIYAAIFLLALFGVLFTVLVVLAERRLLFWFRRI